MGKCEILFHGYTSLIARRVIVINDRNLIRLTGLDGLIKAERKVVPKYQNIFSRPRENFTYVILTCVMEYILYYYILYF